MTIKYMEIEDVRAPAMGGKKGVRRNKEYLATGKKHCGNQ